MTRRLAFFALLLAVLCLLRWPDANRPIQDVDESVSALIADNWLDGGVPYRDAIDQRGPATYLIYAAVFAVAGRLNMAAVHFALLLLIFGSCLLAERFARRLAPGPEGERWGLAAAVLLALCTFTYKRTQLLAFHTEWPMLPLSLGGMFLLWRALVPRLEGASPPAPRRDLFLAGLCFGLSFLAKQPAIFDGGAAGVFLLLAAGLGGRLVTRATLAAAAALFGGFLAAVAVAVGYFAVNGALADFYLYFWSYNVEHYTAVVPYAERFAGLNPWDHSRHYLRSNPLLFAGVVIEIGRAAWALGQRRLAGDRREQARLLLVLWLVFGYFGASFSGRNFGHYFIQIIAPSCLLTGGLVVDSWRAAPRPAWRLALAGLVVASLGFSLHRYHRDMAIFAAGRERHLPVQLEDLMAAVRRLTTPADTIFVWGYHPEVYFFAPRKPASRYSNTNYLTGMLPWENHGRGIDTSAHIVPGAMEILLSELEASKPRLVIDTAPGNHRFYRKYPLKDFPALQSYLAAQYSKIDPVRDRRGKRYYDLYLRHPS